MKRRYFLQRSSMLGAGLFLAPTLIRAGATFHDAEADSYLCKEFRNPWRLPKV